MDRYADATAVRHRRRQRQPVSGGGPLEQRNIGRGVRQVPHAGQLAGGENRLAMCRTQPDRNLQITAVELQRAAYKAIGGRQVVAPIGGRQPVEVRRELRVSCAVGRVNCQAELAPIGDAGDFFAHQVHVVHRGSRPAAQGWQSDCQSDEHRHGQTAQLQPLTAAQPGKPLQHRRDSPEQSTHEAERVRRRLGGRRNPLVFQRMLN